MEKNSRFLCIFLYLFLCLPLLLQAQFTRAALVKNFISESWVREKTRHNDNPRIIEYHNSVNSWLGKMNPVPAYCGSSLYFNYLRTGKKPDVTTPQRAKSWTDDRSKMVWSGAAGYIREGRMPQPGDVALTTNKGSWHVFMIVDWLPNSKYVITVEGNTSDIGQITARPPTLDIVGVRTYQEGVFVKRRSKTQLYAVYSFID
jgi:hypothetical protein